MTTIPCPACAGDGRIPDKTGGGHHGRCPECLGTGVEIVVNAAPRYLIHVDDQTSISRVDKETACYWWELMEGSSGKPYWSRGKKRYDDVIFGTFDEAKAELIRLLLWRLGRTRAMTEPGFIGARDYLVRERLR